MGKQPDSCFVTPGPMCILRIIFSVDIDSEARRDWEAHCRMVVTKVWTVGGQRKQQMGRGSGRPEFHQTGDVILIDGDDGSDGDDVVMVMMVVVMVVMAIMMVTMVGVMMIMVGGDDDDGGSDGCRHIIGRGAAEIPSPKCEYFTCIILMLTMTLLGGTGEDMEV